MFNLLHTFNKKRALVSVPEILVNEAEQDLILCINPAALQIARVLMRHYGYWVSTYARSYSGTIGYVTPTQAEFDTIDAVVSKFLEQTDMGCDLSADLQLLVAGLADLTDVIRQGQAGQLEPIGGCGCGPETGITTQPQATDPGCSPPDGFDNWADFLYYSCRAAKWILDNVTQAMARFRDVHEGLQHVYTGLVQAAKLTPTQVYSYMAQQIANLLPQLITYSLTPTEQSQLITSLTDRYLSFQDDVANTVPETNTLQDRIDHYWNNPLNAAITDLLANYVTIVGDIYQETASNDKATDLLTAIASAFTGVTGHDTAGAQTMVENLVTEGFVQLALVKQPLIANYKVDLDCLALTGCCPAVMIEIGTTVGQTTEAVKVGDDYVITGWLFSEYPDYGNSCATEREPVFESIINYTPTTSPPGYQLWNDAQTLAASGQVLPTTAAPLVACGRKFTATSSTPWKADISQIDSCV